MSVVRLREMSALERAQLQKYKWNSAWTKVAVHLREVSALESVRLERVDWSWRMPQEWNACGGGRSASKTRLFCVGIYLGCYPSNTSFKCHHVYICYLYVTPSFPPAGFSEKPKAAGVAGVRHQFCSSLFTVTQSSPSSIQLEGAVAACWNFYHSGVIVIICIRS